MVVGTSTDEGTRGRQMRSARSRKWEELECSPSAAMV